MSGRMSGRPAMNEALAGELVAMAEEDSVTRERLVESGELAERDYHPLMRAVHERNNRRIQAIISVHGWPGMSLVGEAGADASWLVVQHAVLEPDFQERCIALLEKAVRAGEAKGFHLAMLHDRVLVRQGKPQIYGSQHDIDENGNLHPFPIADPENVDRRRESVGLEPLAERTRTLQADHDRIERNRAGRREQRGR